MDNNDEHIEALTQSVELIAGAQLITERRMGQLAESMNGLTLAMKALAQAHIDHEGSIDKLNDAVNRLSLIAGKPRRSP